MQTMAESAVQLPDAIKSRHEDIDWRGLRGFRNMVVHGYLRTLDLQLTWSYLVSDVERLGAMADAELERI